MLKVKPFLEKSDQRIEVAYEIMVSIISFSFIALNSDTQDRKSNLYIGWVIVSLTLLVFVLNYALILVTLIMILWDKLKVQR